MTHFGGYQENRNVYIIGSNQMFSDAKTHAIKTSAIQYPDPPKLSGNDKAPLRAVPEIATTPDTAAMDAVQSQTTAPGVAEFHFHTLNSLIQLKKSLVFTFVSK